MIAVLAIAGSLAGKRVAPAGPGHLPHRHADLRRPAARRRDHRRRADLLPGPAARPDRPGPDPGAVLSLRRDLIASLIAVVAFTVIFGLAYPLIMTGVSQLLFPAPADGSRIERDGEVVGSSLIGQEFTKRVPRTGEPGKFHRVPDPRYFQSRPSATGYSADVTYFNNLGPNNAELSQIVRRTRRRLPRARGPLHAGLSRADVPVDAVTTSASGVDPHISQANARIQAHRIADGARPRRSSASSELIDETHRRARARLPRRARGQRARAQPRARRGGP